MHDLGRGQMQMCDYFKNDSILNDSENNGANDYEPTIEQKQYQFNIYQARANHPRTVGLHWANQRTFNQTSTIIASIIDGTRWDQKSWSGVGDLELAKSKS